LAEALGAEFYVLHVLSNGDEMPERKRTLESSLQFARNLGAHVVPLTGSDTARATACFIRENRITQAIVGRSAAHGLRSYLYYLAIQKFMSEAPHVDLHIVTQERQ
jgi:two-component system sensor histidine kinase KdpD